MTPPLSTALAPNAFDLFSVSHTDGRIFETSEAFATLLGRTAGEMNERRLIDLIHSSDHAEVSTVLAGLARASEQALECRFLQSDGQPVYVQSVMHPGVGSSRVAGIETADFSAVLAERRDLRARLEMAVAPAVAAMWDLQIDEDIFTWDLDAAQMLGVARVALPETVDQLVELVHPDDQDGLRSAFRRLGETGSADTAVRVGTDARLRHLSFRSRVLDHAAGRHASRAVGLVLDVTLEKALEEQLLRLSVSDGLTGIRNRRGFDQSLRGEWRRCSRAGEPMSVAILDVDHFKLFNDTQGHVLGDQALVAIARALVKTALRDTDIVARYGGEEFGVILSGMGQAEAEARLERMLEAVRELQVRQAPDWTFTISAGLASCYPGQGSTRPSDLLQQADAALYEAKAAGRDRLAVHPG